MELIPTAATTTPSPTDQIQYKLKKDLDPESLASLLSAGIKFFLCQRQQIPVPFERLYVPQIQNSDSLGETSVSESNPEVGVGITSIVPENIENPIDRIRYLRNLRKGSKANKIASGRSYKSIREETRAKITLDKIFDDINILFRNFTNLPKPHSSEKILKSLVLHFGANIYNPKETIVFHIHHPLSEAQNSNDKSNVADLTKITKTFYKSIIMSPLFPNFVDKPLRSTYTHIMLITHNPLPESFRMNHGLIPLEYSSLWSEFSNIESSRKRKQLLINIEHDNLVPTVEQPDSSFYYQFPLLFKGVRK